MFILTAFSGIILSIVEANGCLEVSTEGNIRSVDRVITVHGGEIGGKINDRK